MVAGDAKRIIVIKNISSNLIEEAILILKSEPGGNTDNYGDKSGSCGDKSGGCGYKPGNNGKTVRNDFILKEAESIINRYIKENGLTVKEDRRLNKKGPYIKISVNALINILLLAAGAALIFALSRLFMH